MRRLFLQRRWYASCRDNNKLISRPVRVCIVGSGPGGFYTAKYLLKEKLGLSIDMVEKLPVPFGLVRFGVAPDHPEVKSVQSDFANVASNDHFRFFGNVQVGKDVSLMELREWYDVVVLAYGAASDAKLNIPGEHLNGVYSARKFVNWYNGHPDNANLNPKLDGKSAIVIGHGNVGLDCARILSKSYECLKSTDISSTALEHLKHSGLTSIHVVGRRGPAQSTFTIKELRELTKLDNATLITRIDEMEQGKNPSSLKEVHGQRAKTRMAALLDKLPHESSHDRQIELRYFLRPCEFVADPKQPASVGSVRFEKMKLVGEPNEQKVVGTNEFEIIQAGLVLKSIGYRPQLIHGLPESENTVSVRNVEGRIVDPLTNKSIPGLYCSGWLKRGPSGIIGTNIVDAKNTVSSILADYQHGMTKHPELKDSISDHCKHAISWEKSQKIDEYEVVQGKSKGKSRDKLLTISEMLSIANTK